MESLVRSHTDCCGNFIRRALVVLNEPKATVCLAAQIFLFLLLVVTVNVGKLLPPGSNYSGALHNNIPKRPQVAQKCEFPNF